VPQAEAERLISLGVAAYAGVAEPDAVFAPAAVPEPSPAPPAQEEAPEAAPVLDVQPPKNEDEIAQLERLPRADLEQMAQDLDLDISGAKNKHDLAVLISAADADSEGDVAE